MNEVTIENTQVQIVELKGEWVLTSAQLAQVYKCEPGNIKKNFNDNKERFIEGKHYFKLEGEALQNLRVTNSDLQISPMTKYHARGYTHSETIDFNHKDGHPDVTMNTKWTQKGRFFLYDVLKEHGVLPVIEREATA